MDYELWFMDAGDTARLKTPFTEPIKQTDGMPCPEKDDLVIIDQLPLKVKRRRFLYSKGLSAVELFCEKLRGDLDLGE